jgi:hypothetical protein
VKGLIAAASLLLAIPTFLWAQEADHQQRIEGYVFVADEVTVGAAGGGGGEVFVHKGLALGGEFVRAAPTLPEYNGSVNAFYHFRPGVRTQKVEAFVTGGYTWFDVPNVGLPHTNGGNVGAGLNLWLLKHAALRLELRDAVGGQSVSVEHESGGSSSAMPQNAVTLRIGMTFR